MKLLITAATIAMSCATMTAQAADIHANQVKVPYWGDQQRLNEHNDAMFKERMRVEHHLQGSINDDRKRITANEQWNDRQEGVIRQNRDRLDDNDAMNQRQNASIDNAHARIGGVEQDSIQRDADLYNSIQIVDTASRDRDAVLAQQAQANTAWSVEQFNRQAHSVEGVRAGVESNRQAITNERQARQAGDDRLKAGVAGAYAAAGHQMDTTYRGMQLSLSGGLYDGASAASLAAGGAVSDSVSVFGSVTHDSKGQQGYTISTNWKF